MNLRPRPQLGETLSWRVTRLERDRLGRLVRKHLPDGQVLDYQWSPQGQLQQVLLNGQLLSRHRWDEWGQEVARLQGEVVSQYQYDEAGRLVQHAAGLKGQAAKLLARRYVHDAQGRVQAVDDLRRGSAWFYAVGSGAST